MKVLISPSSASPKNRLLPNILSLTLATSGISACQWSDYPSSFGPVDSGEVDHRVPITLVHHTGEEDNPDVHLGHLLSSSCHQGNVKAIKLMLQSPVGRHSIRITEGSNQVTKIRIDGHDFDVRAGFPIDQEALENFCQEMDPNNQGERFGYATLETGQSIQKLLALTIPACTIQLPQNEYWGCKMDADAPRKISRELAKSHKSLIRKFRRHPYPLLRKTSLSQILAEALLSPNIEEDLEKFCALTSVSLTDELPLVIRSKTFRSSACGSEGNRIEAAKIGLRESLKEIRALTALMARQSRRGILSVRFPRRDIPAKELWITLAPKTIPGLDEIQEQGRCWHPFYGINGPFSKTAASLNLTDQSTNSPCLNHKAHEETQDYEFVDRFIFASIATETEFPITNGRTKVLRLPLGTYDYSVQENPQDFRSLAPGPFKVSQGTISWKTRRPHQKLEKW